MAARDQVRWLADATSHKAFRLFSRNGNDFTERLSSIAKAATDLRCTSAILDAEIVATDEHGRPEFAALHERRPASTHLLILWVFHLLHLDGRDLRRLLLDERRSALPSS